jgi:regulator of cell morphogenesis and NO signaling
MMRQPGGDRTVGQLVVERPERARLFEQLGIDYCCGGKRSLADACARRGLDLGEVLAQIEAAEERPAVTGAAKPTDLTLGALAEHITRRYHAPLREELPRLDALCVKVAAAHGARHPELRALQETFQAFRAELESHMRDEEETLFPACAQLAEALAVPTPASGPFQERLAALEEEHEQAGAALARMRELTQDYAPPADACNTYRVLLAGLVGLEAEMHEHVHLENNLLFPRAQRLAAALERVGGR